MRKYFSVLLAASLTLGVTTVSADNHGSINNKDAKALADYFDKKFPGVTTNDLVNGAYALDESLFMQFEAQEEFPRYEDFVAQGEEFYNTPFKNGKGFADCFGNDTSSIRPRYPHWDKKKQTVVTLEGDINKCLTDNGEKPLGWKKRHDGLCFRLPVHGSSWQNDQRCSAQ